MKSFLIFFLIITSSFLIYYPVNSQNLVINKPKETIFKNPLQAGPATSEFGSAKRIFSALFYIALCLGVISIVKTMVYSPDKSKKVITNWAVGLVIYSIIYNLMG